MGYNYASIDIETTGLDWRNHHIVEVGVVLDDFSVVVKDEDIEDYVAGLPTFHCYIEQKNYYGDPYALSMHPTIFRRIAKREKGYIYTAPEDLAFKLWTFFTNHSLIEITNDKTPRITVAGKNFSSFDARFFDELWYKHPHQDFRFGHKVYDPGQLYATTQDTEPPGLQECLDRAGIKHEVSHTAVDDARAVIKCLKAYYNKK